MNTEDIITLICAIIGACAGLTGMVFGIIGIKHNKYLAVHAFMSGIESKELVAARNHVYNAEQPLSIQDEQAAEVINFLQHWALLARKGYLPMWVFESGAGAGAIRLYETTEQCIKAKREKNSDKTYASDFEWLYNTLKHGNQSNY